MRNVVISALLALALFGSTVGPTYRRPSVESPLSWRFEEREAKEVANTAGWERFDDPVLNERFILRLQNISIEGCRQKQP
jgi:multidrug efflux system outer membrane protein